MRSNLSVKRDRLQACRLHPATYLQRYLSPIHPLMRILLAVVLLACAVPVFAQRLPCGDLSLPPEQRWNPPNSAVTIDLANFYRMSEQMMRAFNGASPQSAEPLAQEYIRTAKSFRCNWNYGNAIHDANSVLGLLALRAGHVTSAVEYLRAAGASSGSPQLNTFGPSMHLAKELAGAGQFAAVAEYLGQVRRFWEMENGSIDRWLSDLSSKRVPDFGSNLRPM